MATTKPDRGGSAHDSRGQQAATAASSTSTSETRWSPLDAFEVVAGGGRGGPAAEVVGELLFEIGHCSAFRIFASARLIHGPTEPGAQPSSRAISSVVSPP